MKTPTPSQLRAAVTATGSHCFSRASMKFFGDRMANYGTRAAIVDGRPAVELYRRRPVNGGLRDSAYFDATTFRRLHPSENSGRIAELIADRAAWMAAHDWRLLEDTPGKRIAVWAMACPDEADELSELMEAADDMYGVKKDMTALAEGRA